MRTSGCWVLYGHVVKDSTGNEKFGGFFLDVQPQSNSSHSRWFWERWEIVHREQGVRSGPVQPWGTARGTAGTVPMPGAGNDGDGRAALLAGSCHCCWIGDAQAAGRCRNTADI